MSTEGTPPPVPAAAIGTILPPPVATAAPLNLPPEVVATINNQRIELERLRQAQTESSLRSALTSALGQHASQLHDGAADQIASLLRPQLQLVQSGNQSVVAGPALQPVDAFVRETLESAAFAHFLKPSGVGGTQGGGGVQVGAGSGSAVLSGRAYAPAAPARDYLGRPIDAETGRVMTLGETLVLERRERIAAQTGPVGDPARNPALPFGLSVPPKTR